MDSAASISAAYPIQLPCYIVHFLHFIKNHSAGDAFVLHSGAAALSPSSVGADFMLRSLLDRTTFVLLRAVMVCSAGRIADLAPGPYFCRRAILIQLLAQLLNPLAAPFGMDGIILLAFLLGWPANEIVIPLMLMMYLSSGTMVEFETYTALHTILTAHG